MSRVPARALVCDRCGETFGSGYLPLVTLRRQARTAGWRQGVAPDLDLCPAHPKDGAR
ncbi:hypothetical protein [Streptomyces sp. T028]|uniref:hypothetical protein n=1 Tax=Streptomyces sp. T028 TaxID=3394379 RepID=UPI003A8AD833